jgi:hypothetical protein
MIRIILLAVAVLVVWTGVAFVLAMLVGRFLKELDDDEPRWWGEFLNAHPELVS